MAWVDSEQMWRLQVKKRSLSPSTSSDPDLPAASEDFDSSPPHSPSPRPHVEKPVKVTRIEEPWNLSSTDLQRPDLLICREPPCHRNPIRFKDSAAYELHHKHFHSLVCVVCRAHFPTENILALHLEERHDPFVEIQRAKKQYKVTSILRLMKYKCYVEGCREMFSGIMKRNQHMMIVHYFPSVLYLFKLLIAELLLWSGQVWD
jgi:hypothetical protein